jgi:hypothetical protein
MITWAINPRVDTCVGCLAWGYLYAKGRCAACYFFHRKWPDGHCLGCERWSALRRGYCRLCWDHARTLAHATGNPKITAVHCIGEVRWPQLFLAHMANLPAPGGRSGHSRRTGHGPAQPATPADRQLVLFRVTKRGVVVPVEDLQQRTERPVDVAWRILRRISQAHGWEKSSYYKTRKALEMVLTGYREGEQLTYSQLVAALRDRGLSVARTAEVLQEMGVYRDDRRPAFDDSLAARLTGLAPGIAAEVEHWARTLAAGTARRAPRTQKTALRYLNAARPALLAWSDRYSHLREVVRDDVLAELTRLSGHGRRTMLIALRSLFGMAKQSGVVFRNPTSRIPVGAAPATVLQPLLDEHLQQVITAAVRPADPLIVALATVHAARHQTLRAVLLDDVDLGNRRIVLAGRSHPLDELTRKALLHWLNYRRATWPTTPNPHLLINSRTAVTTTPVGNSWITDGFRGLDANLERLRMDRHLEEAITHRADPLHLAVVFGIAEKTALRYANSARQLLSEEPKTIL